MEDIKFLDRKLEILDRIGELSDELAFMPIGNADEERIKTIVIVSYILIKKGFDEELFNVLMQEFMKNENFKTIF